MNIVLSVEKLNDLSICPRLYYYKHLLAKVPVKKAEYLESGELMHYGLQIYYKSVAEGTKIPLTQLLDVTRNYAAQKIQLGVEDVETTIKDLAMYYTYYTNLGESWQIEAVEEPFAKVLFEMDDLRIVINGKIDLRAVANNGRGPRILVDHKYESQFRTKYERDNQPLAYSWAYETRDWIYNLVGQQKSYTPEKRLIRPYFSFSDYQIEEWKENTIELVHELIRHEKLNKWPMRFRGCSYHFSKCTFYDVCNTTPDNREYKLEGLFMDKDRNRTVMEQE